MPPPAQHRSRPRRTTPSSHAWLVSSWLLELRRQRPGRRASPRCRDAHRRCRATAVARIFLQASPQQPTNGRRRACGSAAQFGSFVRTVASVSVTPSAANGAGRSTSRTARIRMPRRRLACRRLCRAPVPAPCTRQCQGSRPQASPPACRSSANSQGRRRPLPHCRAPSPTRNRAPSPCRLAAA